MVASLVHVLNVVVDKREAVDQLDGHCRGHRLLDRASRGLAGEETEGGAQGLSLGGGEGLPVPVRPAHVVPEHAVHAGVVLRQLQPQGLAKVGPVPVEYRRQISGPSDRIDNRVGHGLGHPTTSDASTGALERQRPCVFHEGTDADEQVP